MQKASRRTKCVHCENWLVYNVEGKFYICLACNSLEKRPRVQDEIYWRRNVSLRTRRMKLYLEPETQQWDIADYYVHASDLKELGCETSKPNYKKMNNRFIKTFLIEGERL